MREVCFGTWVDTGVGQYAAVVVAVGLQLELEARVLGMDSKMKTTPRSIHPFVRWHDSLLDM